MTTFSVSETFYSLQGEGGRAGSANVFIRFAGCNRTCRVESHGFDCDTDFASREAIDRDDLLLRVGNCVPTIADRRHVGVVLTGGEPLLQADSALCADLHALGFGVIQVETNGSIAVPDGIDYVTVSPKMAEHAVRAGRADELKYVRAVGQPIPQPSLDAPLRFLSPAATAQGIDRSALEWCIGLVKANPKWRLTMQAHKVWGVR